MNTLILFIKGFIIGLGKIIPGVSGSLIAISLGVYEKALDAINSFWKEKMKSFLFLFPIAIGVLLAILLGSHVILNLLETYYIYTVTIFIGLIVGTIPNIVTKEKIKCFDWMIVLFLLFLFFLFHNYINLQEFVPTNHFLSYIYILFLGFLDAFTTVIPGISGTATLLMLGSYTFVLKIFANPFANIFYTSLFGIGFIIGVFVMVKVIDYCLKNHRHYTWICILGFLFTSIFSLLVKTIDLMNHDNIFSLVLLFLIGYNVIRVFDSPE